MVAIAGHGGCRPGLAHQAGAQHDQRRVHLAEHLVVEPEYVVPDDQIGIEEQRDEALEELEAEELEIEDDPETILVDEAAEIRSMRRDELGLEPGVLATASVKATTVVIELTGS